MAATIRRIEDRVAALDWGKLQSELDEQGFAPFSSLLSADECQTLIGLYSDPSVFRKKIDMARYRFGLGEYQYFRSPLPPLLSALRTLFYKELVKTANRWLRHLGREESYPDSLPEFLERCHHHGQLNPTPLLLKYEAGGYNCLHQDLYGQIYFPFQVVFALNQMDEDYSGGEFLVIEQRPRAQSRAHVIKMVRGSGLIFPTQYRPVQGTRGYYRIKLRHGVGTVHSGTRYTLGIIFHDAE